MATISFSIRQAKPGDEPAVSLVLNDAAAWLHERGMPLWKLDELAPERITDDVAAGLYQLVEIDGAPVGTLRFQLSDSEFWPEDLPCEAAYIHRVAVRRAFAGGEVSSKMLQWAADRAAALGRQFLRLDCDAARPKLRAIYERFGFRHHSDRQVGPYFVARYELPVDGKPAYVSRYSFSDYSDAWPAEFAAEAERIRDFLGGVLVAIHHIGSTSVPGLAAKPVIDLLPVVRRIELMDDRAPDLVAAGYRAWGEYGITGRRFFTKDRDGTRTHNLHFFAEGNPEECNSEEGNSEEGNSEEGNSEEGNSEEGNPEIERHLAFAAYLRSHPDVRREYAALKREVYARHPADIAAYSDGKDAWLKHIEPLAVQWYREQRF